MRSPSSLTVGSRVRVRGTFLDEAETRPLTGTVKDMFPRPDWDGQDVFVVLFDHDNRSLPFGGEFSADLLELDDQMTLDELLEVDGV